MWPWWTHYSLDADSTELYNSRVPLVPFNNRQPLLMTEVKLICWRRLTAIHQGPYRHGSLKTWLTQSRAEIVFEKVQVTHPFGWNAMLKQKQYFLATVLFHFNNFWGDDIWATPLKPDPFKWFAQRDTSIAIPPWGSASIPSAINVLCWWKTWRRNETKQNLTVNKKPSCSVLLDRLRTQITSKVSGKRRQKKRWEMVWGQNRKWEVGAIFGRISGGVASVIMTAEVIKAIVWTAPSTDKITNCQQESFCIPAAICYALSIWCYGFVC